MKEPTFSKKSVTVHNVGFYNPPVRAINCMQLQPVTMLLAVSRSDNSIEIWNVAHVPYLQKVLLCEAGNSVEDMKWCGKRLFSCGFQGSVVEHNCHDGTIKNSNPVTGGVAWTLAYNEKCNLFAVGTEDGFINVMEVRDEGLEYVKVLDKQQGRVLCISWDESGTHLVTGSIDVVRVWNLATGHALQKMTTTRSSSTRETVVWSLAVLPDLTIISGDSRGCLTFWDGKLGAQMDSFRSHDADILTVCVAQDGGSVVCAGVDPVLAVYGRFAHGSNRKQWARGGLHRLHHHDVRSIALAPDGTIFSGGVSGILSVIKTAPKLRLSYPPLLMGSCVQVVPKLRQLLLRYHDYVQLWQLGSPMTDSSESDTPLLLATKPTCLLRIDSKSGETILCTGISGSGNHIAFSTQKSLQFFTFNLSESSVHKLDEEYESSTHIAFFVQGRNEKVLTVSRDNKVRIFEINQELVEEISSFEPSKNSCVSDSVSHLLVSPCGAFFALADCSSNVAVWSTTGCAVVASLPHYPAVPTALAFSLDSKSILVAYSDLHVLEFDLKLKKYTEFSDTLSAAGAFHTPIKGIINDPRRSDAIILHDDAAFCTVSRDSKGKRVEEGITRAKTPRDSEDSKLLHATEPSIVIKKFKHIVDVAWVENDELLIVEVTPLSLTESLTPFFIKKKFST